MATVLERGKNLPLNFTSGTILALKPTPPAKALANFEFALCLYSEKGDMLLGIWFFPRSILFQDRAHKSLGNGWGEPHEADMTNVDLKDLSVLDVKVSIHHYLTDSEFGRYQILLNGKTIVHFERRCPGPATQIWYVVGTGGGPPSWDVDIYQIDDLLPEEQLALGPGR
jgi:hypothetical protein